MLPTGDSLQGKRHTQTEVRGWKKIFQANGAKKVGDSNTYISPNKL